MSPEERQPFPEVAYTFVVGNKDGLNYRMVITQVDHEKMEGRFRFFLTKEEWEEFMGTNR